MATAKKKSSRGRKQDRARVAGGQYYEVRYTAKKTKRSAGCGEEGGQEGRQQPQAGRAPAWWLGKRIGGGGPKQCRPFPPGATPKPKKGLSDLRLLWPREMLPCREQSTPGNRNAATKRGSPPLNQGRYRDVVVETQSRTKPCVLLQPRRC